MLVSNPVSVSASEAPIFLKWQTKKFVFQEKTAENSTSQISLFGVSFFKNRQNSLSPNVNQLVCVVWSQNFYQTIPWTLSNVFHMHNMPWKCIENILRAENEASRASEKSFFGHPNWILALMECHFWKIDKIHFLLTWINLYVLCGPTNYIKRFLGP